MHLRLAAGVSVRRFDLNRHSGIGLTEVSD